MSEDDRKIVFFDSIGFNSVEVSLQDIKLSVKNKDFSFSLKVTNKTDMNIAIPNTYLFWFESGETNWWIVVENEIGEKIVYNGRMVSMYLEDLTIDDCTVVRANESIVLNFQNLYESYDFDCEYSKVKYQKLFFYYIGPLGVSEVVSIDKFD